MHRKTRTMLISTSAIFLLLGIVTLHPVVSSQPLLETANLAIPEEHKLNKERVPSALGSIVTSTSWMMHLRLLLSSLEESLNEQFPLLEIIILLLASPLVIAALFVVYIVFVAGIILDLIGNIPEYESIWEVIRVIMYIIISPFGFPLFLKYIIILWIVHILQDQLQFSCSQHIQQDVAYPLGYLG